MKFLLEYCEKQANFHYNFINSSGVMNQPLSTNGYFPITIVTDEIHENKEFTKLMDMLSFKKLPFEKVREVVLLWLLDNEDRW